MTDRIKGFVVVLDQDIREDDVQPLLDAIRQLRHVVTVAPMVATADDYVARSRRTQELRAKLFEFIRTELGHE